MGNYKGFSSVKLNAPQRSTFDLSHEVRLSTKMGKLTPIFMSETLPNDTFYGSTEVLVKMAPMLAPIMHRVNMYVHYFFVPNRLLWEDWEEFITGGRLGDAVTTPPVTPRATIDFFLAQASGLLAKGSVFDYMGGTPIPDGSTWPLDGNTLDLMPFAAWYKIYMDYYRDRNYEEDTDFLPLQSGLYGGGSETTILELCRDRYRCWEHDYYTSALPFTQRGAEVLVPMVGVADTVYDALTGNPAPAQKYLGTDTALNPGRLVYADSENPAVNAAAAELRVENTEISINDLRRAVRLQEWLERNALAGSRYNESIMAHFARRTSDARLQRAEYIGGGKAVVQISEVMTTAYSEDVSAEVVPPGNYTGKGQAYSNTNRFSYNCEEHGFVIGVLSVLPTSGYMQGLPRMFQTRNTFLDYPWPSFAHLGEQPVFDYEIYQEGNVPEVRDEATVFGYQSRYADWKYISSRAAGDFRDSLDFWHLTRKFSETPNLNDDFVHFEASLQDRIFAVSGVDTVWLYAHNNIHVKRSLPYFGTPNL